MRLSSTPLTRALVLLLPRLLLALAPGVSPSTPQPRLDVGATLGRGHYGEVFVYEESRVAKRASVLAPRESLLLLGGSRLLHSLLRRRVAAPTLADGARVLAAGGVICAAEALTLRRGGALSTLLSRGAALLAGLDRCALLE